MTKFYKIMFFNTMIMGTMISISAYSWMSMWMGLEINLLSVIPLFNSTKNMLSSESSIKYFLTQTLASTMLMFSMIMLLVINEFITPLMNSIMLLMLNSALLTKLGAAPFHFWFPEVMEGLTWFNSTILLTWQKIAPMILLMNNPSNLLLNLTIISSLVISSLMMLNQTSLRKILAFSSINHIAWMLSATMISNSIWMIYFIVYSILTINLTTMMNWTNSFYIKQIFNYKNNKMMKLTFMMNFMSLSGLPPLLGFFPKWMVINWLMNNNMSFMSLTLIILTLISLFIYMRMMFSSLLIISNEMKINSQMSKKNILLKKLNMLSLISLPICTFMFNFL